MTTESVGLTAMALRLASATKPCPEPLCHNGTVTLAGEYDLKHADCDGIGEVFVLPNEVRVECLCFDKANNGLCRACVRSSKGKEFIEHAHNCLRCNGRGWTPLNPEKLGRWMVAWFKIFPAQDLDFCQENNQDKYACELSLDTILCDGIGDTPELAFFAAALKALNLEQVTEKER